MVGRRHIQPGEKGLIQVIFSDSAFSTISVRPPNPIHAVISSKEALDAFHPRIIEHGFTVGDFKIEIAITSDNSRPHKSYFRVHVGNQWDRLSMSNLSWFEGLVAKLRSWMHSR